PHQHLAIEFNGTYWHSEGAGRTADFHQNKSAMAAEAGYQLLHVWADDFEHRRGAIIRTIAHKMHAVDRLPLVLGDLDDVDTSRVMARTLRLEQVPSREARQFLTLHHVQGAVGATIHLGLRDEQGRLRALLSLRSPRANARMHRDSGQWEIQRYATAGIVAGASPNCSAMPRSSCPSRATRSPAGSRSPLARSLTEASIAPPASLPRHSCHLTTATSATPPAGLARPRSASRRSASVTILRWTMKRAGPNVKPLPPTASTASGMPARRAGSSRCPELDTQISILVNSCHEHDSGA